MSAHEAGTLLPARRLNEFAYGLPRCVGLRGTRVPLPQPPKDVSRAGPSPAPPRRPGGRSSGSRGTPRSPRPWRSRSRAHASSSWPHGGRRRGPAWPPPPPHPPPPPPPHPCQTPPPAARAPRRPPHRQSSGGRTSGAHSRAPGARARRPRPRSDPFAGPRARGGTRGRTDGRRGPRWRTRCCRCRSALQASVALRGEAIEFLLVERGAGNGLGLPEDPERVPHPSAEADDQRPLVPRFHGHFLPGLDPDDGADVRGDRDLVAGRDAGLAHAIGIAIGIHIPAPWRRGTGARSLGTPPLLRRREEAVGRFPHRGRNARPGSAPRRLESLSTERAEVRLDRDGVPSVGVV